MGLERVGLGLLGQVGVWGVLGPPTALANGVEVSFNNYSRPRGWVIEKDPVILPWLWDRASVLKLKGQLWIQHEPRSPPSIVCRGWVGWSRPSMGSRTSQRQSEEHFQHLTASVPLIAPLGSRVWVILKLFLERALPVRVTWILKKKTNTRTKGSGQGVWWPEHLRGWRMHPLLQGKAWCGGLQGHVPGQTLTSREAQGESAAGETTRGSGGPGGGGASAVGSPAPSQCWPWEAVKGLCWEGRKQGPDEAVLSSKCDQATASLKTGLLLEPRASLAAQMVKNLLAMQEARFDPWVGKVPWKREWPPTLVYLPGGSQGQRSLEGLSPWGLKESDRTEQLLEPKWVKSHGFCRKCHQEQGNISDKNGPRQWWDRAKHLLTVPAGSATCSGFHNFPLISLIRPGARLLTGSFSRNQL